MHLNDVVLEPSRSFTYNSASIRRHVSID
jgi:hypothetical protein